MALTLEQLAGELGAELAGSRGNPIIRSVSSIARAHPESLVFAEDVLCCIQMGHGRHVRTACHGGLDVRAHDGADVVADGSNVQLLFCMQSDDCERVKRGSTASKLAIKVGAVCIRVGRGLPLAYHHFGRSSFWGAVSECG